MINAKEEGAETVGYSREASLAICGFGRWNRRCVLHLVEALRATVKRSGEVEVWLGIQASYSLIASAGIVQERDRRTTKSLLPAQCCGNEHVAPPPTKARFLLPLSNYTFRAYVAFPEGLMRVKVVGQSLGTVNT
jgi:hypothetical protein